MRGSKKNNFGSLGSIIALTQWVFGAPNVSTGVRRRNASSVSLWRFVASIVTPSRFSAFWNR
jgi:hypothetical protein